jgi:hypothetical protein
VIIMNIHEAMATGTARRTLSGECSATCSARAQTRTAPTKPVRCTEFVTDFIIVADRFGMTENASFSMALRKLVTEASKPGESRTK